MKQSWLSKLDSLDLKNHFINKNDFLNYFKIPKPFLFLKTSEIENFFSKDNYLSFIEELNSDETISLLTEYDSPIKLFSENFSKLNKLLEEELKKIYIWKFKLSPKDFHDHSIYASSLDQFKDLLHSNKDFFIFKPQLKVDVFQISPTAIFRYKGKIYVIENIFSMTLKREKIAYFLFYEYVFKKILKIEIFQYLTSYFKDIESKNLDLQIDITNGLPFSKKIHKPINSIDPLLKNVNVFLNKKIDVYDDTIYELFLSRKDFYEINDGKWDFEMIEVDFIIEKIKKFKDNPDRNIDMKNLISNFLIYKKSLIPPENIWLKFLLKNSFENYDFSHKLFSFDKMIKKIIKKPKEFQKKIMKNLSNLNFLDFKNDQDFLLIEDAKEEFIKKLKNKKKKIYYDFETFSFPFPIFKNTKPYRQLVVQFSSLEVEGNIEKKVKNEIFDPKKLSLENYKKLVDELYDDTNDIAYIVYNKSFENTRLSEIQKMIGEDEYSKKIDWIKKNTVDLADWFVWGKKSKIIHRKLKGFYSIKKVIDLIPKDFLNKTGTICYSNLYRCQNGLIASALFLSRMLSSKNLKTENEIWERNKKIMIKYCENDVRSMWAAELLIENFIKINKYPFYSIDTYLEQKSDPFWNLK